MTDEADLVRRARRGDREAFSLLALAHRARVRGVLFRLLGAEHLDDHEQEVFVSAWRSLGGFRGEAAFGTWILRIAVHRAKRFLVRRRPEPRSIDERDERADDGRTAPGRGAARNERAESVRRAIESLPHALRVAFVLRYVEGLSGKAVAEVLGRAEGTVRSDLFAARRALSKILGEEILDE